MTPNVTIRPARPLDRSTLESLQDHLTEPSPTTLHGALAGAGTVVVAVPPGESTPVGYCLGIPGGETAWLAELVVAPEHRRAGIGGKLLDACCRSLQNDHDSARLAVAVDNHAAQSLYRRLGFREVRRVDDYYDYSDGLIFERPLDDSNPNSTRCSSGERS